MEGHLFKLETNTAAHLVSPINETLTTNKASSMASRACRLRPSEKYSFLMQAHSFLGNAVRAGTLLSGWSLITINLWIKTQKINAIINITQCKRSNNNNFYSYHIHTNVLCDTAIILLIEEGTKQEKTWEHPMPESFNTLLSCLFHYVNCISNRKVCQTTAKSNIHWINACFQVDITKHLFNNSYKLQRVLFSENFHQVSCFLSTQWKKIGPWGDMCLRVTNVTPLTLSMLLLACFCNGCWQWMLVMLLNLLIWKQDGRFCRVPMFSRRGCPRFT